MIVVDELAQWFGDQLDIEAEAARAAMVKLGDVEWYVANDLREAGERYSIRSEPTCRAVARVQHIDGDEGDGVGVLDGHAAAGHIAEWSPHRVLREIEAKRQVLDEHQDVNDGSCGTCVDGQWGYPTHGGSSPQRYPCRTLRLLALPYADRPDYREEWRP